MTLGSFGPLRGHVWGIEFGVVASSLLPSRLSAVGNRLLVNTGCRFAWQGRGNWHFATQVFGQRLISFLARIWDLCWLLRGSIGTRWADWGAPRPRLGQRLSGYSAFVLSFPPFCFREPGLLSFWLIQGAVLRGRGEGFRTSLLRFLATVYSVFWPGFGSFCGCSGAPSGRGGPIGALRGHA